LGHEELFPSPGLSGRCRLQSGRWSQRLCGHLRKIYPGRPERQSVSLWAAGRL